MANPLYDVPGLGGFLASQDRRRAMGQQDMEGNIQQMKLADLFNQRERQKKLQEVMNQSGGDPAKAVPLLLQNGFQQEAAQLHALLPKPAEPYNLAPGMQRRGGNNELIATAPEKTLPIPKEPTTTTEVIDPKDPTRMLRVIPTVYQGGTVGERGVVGISGKEPSAAKKEQDAATGATSVDNIIADLRDKYTQLDTSGGITNPDKGVAANLQAGIGSSGLGQFGGRMFGTQNQSVRNQIAQTRPLLLSAIKQRTGMSAKQMDSNVELKLWLSTATDPQLDIKANMNALDNIEKMLGSGKLNANNVTSAQPVQYEQTATNPKTGVKIGLRNGKWEQIK